MSTNFAVRDIIRGFLILSLFHLAAWVICIPVSSVIAIFFGDLWGWEILYRWCRGFWYWQLVYALPLLLVSFTRRHLWICVGMIACFVISQRVHEYIYDNIELFDPAAVWRFILDDVYLNLQ